jgi:hypothetical protein
VTLQNLQGHWLIDVVRNCVLSSEIQHFLEEAARVRIAHFCALGQPTFKQAVAAAEGLLADMAAHVALIPPDVRLLLKHQRGGQSGRCKLDRVDVLFVAPALVNPKAYGNIPRTLFFNTDLADLWRTLFFCSSTPF